MSRDFKYAFSKSLPVMAGYVFLGIAFGIVLEEAGYNFIWAFVMSLFVYAGSMQFTMVPLMATAVSPVTMAVTTLFVNARHLFYGLSFVESFKKIKERPYMIFALTDETYSVLCGCRNEDPDEEKRDSWFLIAILNHSYWIAGSVIGAVIGQALPIDFTGIDFSMTALFAVILVEQILTNPGQNIIIAAISLIIATTSLVILDSSKFLLPALIVTVFFVSVFSMVTNASNKSVVEDDASGSNGGGSDE